MPLFGKKRHSDYVEAHPAKTNKSKYTALIIFVIWAVLMSLLAFRGWKDLEKSLASKDWPVTDGKITLSKVEIKRGSRDQGWTYTVNVKYSYLVDGVKYSGDKISFGYYSSSSPRKANEIKRSYPVGKQVPVYYNPEDPYESVLETKSAANAYIELWSGLIIGSLCWIGFFWQVRKKLF